MLHQISWVTYGTTICVIALIYYGYVGLAFYRTEFKCIVYRLTGKQLIVKTAGRSDLQLPDYNIAGAIQPDEIDFVSQDELDFVPSDEVSDDHTEANQVLYETLNADIHLLGDFSEMVSEVKTLIRVINESGESKENFEMLFRLIAQKYAGLKGSVYEPQINAFLIGKGADQFPFRLTLKELKSYWTNEEKSENT